MWPVSRRVNKTGTGDDDPSLVDEVAGWTRVRVRVDTYVGAARGRAQSGLPPLN